MFSPVFGQEEVSDTTFDYSDFSMNPYKYLSQDGVDIIKNCPVCLDKYYADFHTDLASRVGKYSEIDKEYFSTVEHIRQSPKAAMEYFRKSANVKTMLRTSPEAVDTYFGNPKNIELINIQDVESITAIKTYFSSGNNIGKNIEASNAFFKKIGGPQLSIDQGIVNARYNSQMQTLSNGRESLSIKDLPSQTLVRLVKEGGFVVDNNRIAGFGLVIYTHSQPTQVDNFKVVFPQSGGTIIKSEDRIGIGFGTRLDMGSFGAVTNTDQKLSQLLSVYTDGMPHSEVFGATAKDPAVLVSQRSLVANKLVHAKLEKGPLRVTIAGGDTFLYDPRETKKQLDTGNYKGLESYEIYQEHTTGKINGIRMSPQSQNALQVIRNNPIAAHETSGYSRKGDEVRAVQEMLKEIGFSDGKKEFVDGKYGKRTTAAIKKFQEQYSIGKNDKDRLDATGNLDAATMQALVDITSQRVQVISGDVVKGSVGSGWFQNDDGNRNMEIAVKIYKVRENNIKTGRVDFSNLITRHFRLDTQTTVSEYKVVDYFNKQVQQSKNNAQRDLLQNMPSLIYKYAREAEQRYGVPIDPAKLVALAMHETYSDGFFGSRLAREAFNVGGMKADSQWDKDRKPVYHVTQRDKSVIKYRKFANVNEGAKAFVEWMYQRPYYYQANLWTMDQISNVYCPTKDSTCVSHAKGWKSRYQSLLGLK